MTPSVQHPTTNKVWKLPRAWWWSAWEF